MSELTKALVEVQSKLPTITKSQMALVPTKTGGSYSYKCADLSAIVEAVYPILTAAGLAWTALPTYDEQDRFVLRYELRHVSGEALSGCYPLPDPSSAKAQEIGSAITYAKRYALSSAVGIVPDEDDDGQLAQQARHSRSGGNPKRSGGAAGKKADPETGEITEPPNVSAVIEKLSQEGRKELQERMSKANYPAP